MTTPPATCPQCGTPLQAGVLGGLCPECVRRVALVQTQVEDDGERVADTLQRSKGGRAARDRWEPPSLAEMQALLPQYDFEKLIGCGGMGAVYRARQISLDRLVAIKVLPGDLVHDEDANFAERFKNEARTMARMRHPGIVQVYEFGETADGLLYFVMEYIDGTDVAKMVKSQGRLPPEHALAIAAHVCDALSYAHAQGVIHRDIKPANILIDSQGTVKVADFGLAKVDDPETAALTRTNVAMGTPDYVAPEALITGMPVDQRADLYAVGVMLYNMLSGEIPRGMFLMPGLKHGTDRRFDAIIAKAMQTDPEARYQSASEIRRDLDVILTTPIQKEAPSRKESPANPPVRSQPQIITRLPARPANPAPPARQPPKRRSGRLSTAVLILLILGASGYLWRNRHVSNVAELKVAIASALSSGLPTSDKRAVTASALPPLDLSPDGTLRHGGHCYRVHTGLLNWQQAKAEAERLGGHLATVTSREENDALIAAFSHHLDVTYASLWIGGFRTSVEAQWNWVTGEPFEAFTDWDQGEPNSTSLPAYACLWRHSIKEAVFNWNDGPDQRVSFRPWRGFIIEWDTPEIPRPPPIDTSKISATKEGPFVNSLGMRFVPVIRTNEGHRVLFSVWETRNRDFGVFAADRPPFYSEWKDIESFINEADHPVVAVNWDEALGFAHWLTDYERANKIIGPHDLYRLPTDLEWSTAADIRGEFWKTPRLRSLKSASFPWGTAWPPPPGAGNYADDSAEEFCKANPLNHVTLEQKGGLMGWINGYRDDFPMTAPVGSFPANRFGLHDLGGNVAEWASDLWDAATPTTETRTVRGSSWADHSNIRELVTSYRRDVGTQQRSLSTGFRVVLETR